MIRGVLSVSLGVGIVFCWKSIILGSGCDVAVCEFGVGCLVLLQRDFCCCCWEICLPLDWVVSVWQRLWMCEFCVLWGKKKKGRKEIKLCRWWFDIVGCNISLYISAKKKQKNPPNTSQANEPWPYDTICFGMLILCLYSMMRACMTEECTYTWNEKMNLDWNQRMEWK